MLNEAENVLTDEARYSLFRRKLLDRIEGIVRESVKPMEKIEGIRILQVDGLNGNGGGNGGRSATDEVIDSALRYRVQAPLIDSILSDIGVEGGSLAKMPGLIREARDMQGIRDSSRKGGGDGKPASPPAASRTPAAPKLPPSAARARKERERVMARVYVSTVVNARNDRVWARVRDFNGLPNWHPAIAESRIEGGEPADKIGCVRDFRLRNGDRIREKLLGLSDYDMFCTYSILESPMGVENYVATLRLTPVTDGDQTFHGMDRRVRLRARARGGAGRQYRRRRVPGRLRRAEARVRRLAVPHIVKSTILNAPTDAVVGRAARFQRTRPLASGGRDLHDRARADLRQDRLRPPLQAEGRLGAARAIAGAVRSRTDLQLLPARYADPDVQLRGPCPPAAGHRRRPHLLALGVALHDPPEDRDRLTEWSPKQIYQAGFEAIRQHLSEAHEHGDRRCPSR